ncbi:MAG: Glu-tRNA(Gln) amidotransferase subunit GatE [Candidatus Aenigmatarchaeota archaeon]
MLDYKKLGLRVGLEIHQQLASGHKLFCRCKIGKSAEFPLEVRRKLRPAAGETGSYDPASAYEFLRNRAFVYRSDPQTSCLVELDDDPPKNINEVALVTAIKICRMLGCNVLEELHVMRKNVTDGSSVSGFQRTMLMGIGGNIETSFGNVGIQTVCLEEDSAPVLKKTGDAIEYRLDRLGIPLVEIATLPSLHSPEQVRETAEKMGVLLRSVDVVRGIGSIRQDVNISIEDGSRVEIKGFQELEKIEKVVENEVTRQVSLLEIRNELHKRGVKQIDSIIVDATDIFAATKYDFIRKIIDNDGIVLACSFPFSGLMGKQCGDRTFGKELSGYAEAYGYGLTHSEEAEKYKLTNEFEQLKRELKTGDRGVIIIFAGEDPRNAANAVVSRAKECLNGVPEETRVSDDIGSKYTRPLPGSDRMYPESDIQPISTRKYENIETPKTLIEKADELKKRLPNEIVSQLISSQSFPLFEEFSEKFNIDPLVVARTLLFTLKELKRGGVPIENISKSDIAKLFGLLEESKITKQSLPKILELLAKGEKLETAAAKFAALAEEGIIKIIEDIMLENPNKSEPVLMGLIMNRLQGRADGETVMKILRKLVSERSGI